MSLPTQVQTCYFQPKCLYAHRKYDSYIPSESLYMPKSSGWGVRHPKIGYMTDYICPDLSHSLDFFPIAYKFPIFPGFRESDHPVFKASFDDHGHDYATCEL